MDQVYKNIGTSQTSTVLIQDSYGNDFSITESGDATFNSITCDTINTSDFSIDINTTLLNVNGSLDMNNKPIANAFSVTGGDLLLSESTIRGTDLNTDITLEPTGTGSVVTASDISCNAIKSNGIKVGELVGRYENASAQTLINTNTWDLTTFPTILDTSENTTYIQKQSGDELFKVITAGRFLIFFTVSFVNTTTQSNIVGISVNGNDESATRKINMNRANSNVTNILSGSGIADLAVNNTIEIPVYSGTQAIGSTAEYLRNRLEIYYLGI